MTMDLIIQCQSINNRINKSKKKNSKREKKKFGTFRLDCNITNKQTNKHFTSLQSFFFKKIHKLYNRVNEQTNQKKKTKKNIE